MKSTKAQANQPPRTPLPGTSPNTLDDIRDHVIDLIERATGQRQAIIAHALIVDFFDRDHNAAILLNQILYWSSRTNDPDGWFHKTYKQWRDELRFSTYQVMRVVRGDDRVLKEKRTLWSIGLETKVCMAPNGRNAVHYRLNIAAFMTAFTEWLVETYGIVLGKQADQPAQRRPARDDKKLNLFSRYRAAFGPADAEHRRAVWSYQHQLGRAATFEVVAACVGRVYDWHGVCKELEDAVLDKLTRPNAPDVDATPTLHHFADQRPAHLPASDRITDALRDDWTRVMTNLRLHMRSDFDVLLRDSQLVDHTTNDGETFTLVVADAHTANTLNRRWDRFTRRYASDALGRDVRLHFVLWDEWSRQRE